jgi:hypothetical protein
MPEPPKLQASLTVLGTFSIGGNPQPANAKPPRNSLSLVIKNLGEPVERTSDEEVQCLYLTGSFGTDAKALFQDPEDAARVEKTIPGKWYADWEFFERTFRLKVFTSKATLFEKHGAPENRDTVKIDLNRVISQTAPGTATLEFTTDFGTPPQPLSIEKKSDGPDIISFTSDPPEGVQNFPGDEVTLKWRTHRLTNLELTQIGIADLLPCDSEQDEGEYTVTPSTDANFRLRGYDGNRPIDRILGVRVLRNDWYDLKHVIREGDPAMPHTDDEDAITAMADGVVLEPTLLLNAKNVLLYGIFRHQFQGRERALLFRTKNPFGGWQHVESQVIDEGVVVEGAAIPEGFSCSPGVYVNDAIWLIGGSQIDPANRTNTVWRGSVEPDPKTGTKKVIFRKLAEQSPWPVARMGHAVVESSNKIWLMGGRDRSGNPLKDVWSLDPATGKWCQDPRSVPWEARCLFSLVDHAGKIWLYGGATQPFADNNALFNDLWTLSGSGWEQQKITGIICGRDGRAPIASCLQVFQTQLCLFGKFRNSVPSDTSGMVESLAFSLADLNTKMWSRFSSDRLQNWWGDTTTFNYQLVNFNDRMLVARASGRKSLNAVMQVYVALQ